MVSATELRESEFLKGFTEPELAALASVASHSRWAEGETLFREGSLAGYLYILKSGTILLHFPNGRSLPLRGGGHAIGWSSLVSPFKYTATAVCLTDADLYEFRGRDLYRLIQMDADFGKHLMRKISGIMEERRAYRSMQTQAV